jgi:large subunit ribosomal protein L17
MRHKKHTFKIGRSGAHRRAMLANMVCSLFDNGEIRTTITKAKEARRLAEKMITRGKKGDLHSRRLAIAKLRNKESVKNLFDVVALRFMDREGGYTRIIRLGRRIGDAAEICILQLVEDEVPKKKSKKTKKADKKSAEAAPVEEVKAEEVPVEAAVEETPAAEEEAKAEEAPAETAEEVPAKEEEKDAEAK